MKISKHRFKRLIGEVFRNDTRQGVMAQRLRDRQKAGWDQDMIDSSFEIDYADERGEVDFKRQSDMMLDSEGDDARTTGDIYTKKDLSAIGSQKRNIVNTIFPKLGEWNSLVDDQYSLYDFSKGIWITLVEDQDGSWVLETRLENKNSQSKHDQYVHAKRNTYGSLERALYDAKKFYKNAVKGKLRKLEEGKKNKKKDYDESKCLTPDAMFHIEIGQNHVSAEVDVPESATLKHISDEEAENLEDKIHDAMEEVLAKYFESHKDD